MLMVYLIVLARYRNLIPLLWALMVVEVLFRLTVGQIHPLTPDYYARTPPGKLGNLPILILSLTMVALAVRNTLRSPAQPSEGEQALT